MPATPEKPTSVPPTWNEITSAVRGVAANDRGEMGRIADEYLKPISYKQVWNILNRSTDGTWSNGLALLTYLRDKGIFLESAPGPALSLVTDPDYKVRSGDTVEVRGHCDPSQAITTRALADTIPGALGSEVSQWTKLALRVWSPAAPPR